jgi:gamma-glutamyltranspeptidase/glutathione hydrolase
MVPNQFGLVGSEANAIAPGKRMLSSMTPTIIEKEGDFYMALGAPGGPTIISSVFQVFLNTAVFNLPLNDAIASPRFHHQWLPDELWVERGLFPDSLRAPLQKLGYQLTEKKSLGRIKAVMRLDNGKLMGGGDPRNPDDDAAGY